MATTSNTPELPSEPKDISEALKKITASAGPDEVEKALEEVIPKILRLTPILRSRFVKYLRRTFDLTKAQIEEIGKSKKKGRLTYRGGSVQENGGRYVICISEDEFRAISSFRLNPREYVIVDGKTHIIADIVDICGRTTPRVVFPVAAFRSTREFKKYLPSLHHSFIGNDDQVEGILRLLSQDDKVPEIEGTKSVGYIESQEGPRWVAPDVVIGPDGVDREPNIACIASRSASSLPGRLRYTFPEPAQARALAAQVLPLLVLLNAPAVILTVLGWTMAALVKPVLQRLQGHFPILFLWARKSAGKSSLVRLIWRLFGVTNTKPYSANNTLFPQIELLSSTTSIPAFLDEFKPKDMGQQRVDQLHRLLRRAYDGEVERRGNPDQSVNEYALSAPIIVAGECRPLGDDALLDRLLEVSPDRDYLSTNTAAKDAFRRLRKLPLEELATSLASFALRQDVAAELEAAETKTEEIVARILKKRSATTDIEVTVGDVPTRRYDNLVVMVFGLGMLVRFAREMRVDLPALDLEPALERLLDGILDAGRTSRDPFDDFLEALSIYARDDKLIEGKHYAYVGDNLYMHLSFCYDVYLRERRSAGKGDDTNGLPALRLLIAEKIRTKSYIVRTDGRVELLDGKPRLIEIDVAEATRLVGFEPFPHNQERTHGGRRRSGEGRDPTYAAMSGDGEEPEFREPPPPSRVSPKRPVS